MCLWIGGIWIPFVRKRTYPKGQIIWECLLWNHQFSKIPPKNFIDFCPRRFYRYLNLCWINLAGQKSIKFFGGILENRWFHKYILTLSDLYVLSQSQILMTSIQRSDNVRMYLWNHWFSKIPPKNLIDFCPARFIQHKYLVYKIFLGRNLSNFWVVFWKIDDFIKDILRLSDL